MKTRVRILFIFLLVLTTISGCKKKPDPPSITTKSITQITTNSADSGGDIVNDGGAPVISRGLCWNTSDNPAITDFKTVDPFGSDSFVNHITSLNPNTTYYVRAYATNSAGTSYGSSLSFKTLGSKPIQLSVTATDILTTSATLNSTVNPGSLTTTVSFEYGLTISYGSVSEAVQSPLEGESALNVNTAISGLKPGTIYHFRLKAENSLGIVYSDDQTFTTLGALPQITLLKAGNIMMYTATINGTVNPNYLPTENWFEWGTSVSYGHSVHMTNILTGNTPTEVSLNLSGLEQGTSYHFRIKAVNELGIKYSDDFSFTTVGPVADVDGNIYKVVTIGTQIWMSENLATTKYNDGNEIALVSDPAAWGSTTDGGYCWYDNNKELYKTPYGALYNFYSVKSGHLCPAGFHIPSQAEWNGMIDYLTTKGYGYNGRGDDVAKSLSSVLYWQNHTTPGVVGNDPASNNASGFSAVPAGGRDAISGAFTSLGYSTVFWTSTQIISNVANSEAISYSLGTVAEGSSIAGGGYSVRCIYDGK